MLKKVLDIGRHCICVQIRLFWHVHDFQNSQKTLNDPQTVYSPTNLKC